VSAAVVGTGQGENKKQKQKQQQFSIMAAKASVSRRPTVWQVGPRPPSSWTEKRFVFVYLMAFYPVHWLRKVIYE
jgi:hypothetical protein